MGVDSVGSPWLVGGFAVFIVAMLVLDLVVFHRRAHSITMREAAAWSAVWVALSLVFCGFVFWRWGSELGNQFLTGYLIEKALSVDNLFVFYVIFSAFSVPSAQQHRLLTLGIIGALLLRAAMIWGGAYLLSHFHWLVYVFGVILFATGVRMLVRRHEKAAPPEESRLFRAISKVVPTATGDHGKKLFVRVGHGWRATPFFLVLLLVEASDVVFAVDSILAIFAISEDPFIVFTSNIFAVMGMRALYFLLAGMADRFRYLQPGLALVMMFVGAKMGLVEWIHVPVLVSLAVVSVLLGGSIALSLLKSRRKAEPADSAEAATGLPPPSPSQTPSPPSPPPAGATHR
jgi:tellurite resistance protein TerC